MTIHPHRQVIIIGSGPAGLTAAVYVARASLAPLVIEGEPSSSSDQPGGQLMLTTEVENFPGFPEGVQGPELMQRMRDQAARFGAEFLTEKATKIDFSARPHRVWVRDDEYSADVVIVGSGVAGLTAALHARLTARRARLSGEPAALPDAIVAERAAPRGALPRDRGELAAQLSVAGFDPPDAALRVSLLPRYVHVRGEPRLAMLAQLVGDGQMAVKGTAVFTLAPADSVATTPSCSASSAPMPPSTARSASWSSLSASTTRTGSPSPKSLQRVLGKSLGLGPITLLAARKMALVER